MNVFSSKTNTYYAESKNPSSQLTRIISTDRKRCDNLFLSCHPEIALTSSIDIQSSLQ